MVRPLVVILGTLAVLTLPAFGEAPRRLDHAKGVCFFRPSDTFYSTEAKWAAHLPRGAFMFGAHGKPGRLEEVSYEESIGQLLPQMKRAGHIFLHVCDAGLRGPNRTRSLASRVAREAGRPVVAAMGSIMGNPLARPDGRCELVSIVVRTDRALDLVPKAKAWRVFYPDGRTRPLIADRYFRKILPSAVPGR